MRNGRRVGVLYKGYRSWVDSNVFVGLGGGALELWNAPYEGLFAETVLFRNNTVRDVCQLSRGTAPIWTSVPRPDSATRPTNVHADLRIEGNLFDTGPGPTFWLNDIHSVTITSNTIFYCSKAVVYPSGGVLYTSSNTGNVAFQEKMYSMLLTRRDSVSSEYACRMHLQTGEEWQKVRMAHGMKQAFFRKRLRHVAPYDTSRQPPAKHSIQS
eukprot:COSAG02_NODE_414_length_22826_cov_9.001364_18_plen_212_part_00